MATLSIAAHAGVRLVPTLAGIMEVERERVERHLLGLATHFGSWGSGPLQRSQSREQIDAARRVRFEHAAQALTAIEAISESDIEPFRRRLEHEIEHASVLPAVIDDDELARRARGLLAARLRELEDAVDDSVSGEQSDARHANCIAAFERASTAFARCGALAEADLARWRERLCEVDGWRTWWLEQERRRRRCTLTELRTVVRGEATRTGTLQIATAELYADGVVLRWRSHAGMVAPPSVAESGDPTAAGWYPPAPVSLTDDVGTEYLHVHTGQVIRVAGGPVAGTSTFATTVPAAATHLVAEMCKQRLTIALDGSAKRP